VPDVQACTGGQRNGQLLDGLVVGLRVSERIARVLEQEQHAVGLVDLATAPDRVQVPGDAVVGAPERRCSRVSERFGRRSAVDHVGQQKGSSLAHGLA